jgi:hypothetical protein
MRALHVLVPAALCCLAAPLAAAEIEPGEWEFTTTTTSRLLPGPQVFRFRRCIRREEAQNPDKWMAEPGQQSGCRINPSEKSGDTYAWTMTCPHGNIVGAGSARLSGGSMEGETQMTGEMQGQKFDLRTRVSGKRVGPCKS